MSLRVHVVSTLHLGTLLNTQKSQKLPKSANVQGAHDAALVILKPLLTHVLVDIFSLLVKMEVD